MGRGDSRSKKGKTFKASYGNSRPHAKRKSKADLAKAASAGTSKTKTTATKTATKPPSKKR